MPKLPLKNSDLRLKAHRLPMKTLRLKAHRLPMKTRIWAGRAHAIFKNLLTPLFLMGCFPVDFQEAKQPLRDKSGKRPIKGGKRPIKEGKRPIKAMVLVGISVGCLMGCFPSKKAH